MKTIYMLIKSNRHQIILNNKGIYRLCQFFLPVFLTVVLILFASFPALAKNQKSNIKIATSSLFDNQLKLKTYDPECGINESCNVWKNFRNSHPFPYQTIAVSPAKNGDAVLIISEPPPLPGLTRNKLEQFVKTTFGADLIEYETRRWMIGADGWLEDAVARIKIGDPRYAKKPEKDPVFLDRVGVLQSVLFGTRLGSVIERADADYQSIAQGAASDVDATPSELSSWLQFNAETWTSLNPYQSHFYISLNKLLSGSAPGAYIGAEKQLTLFVLPAKILDEARVDNATMEALRTPFRLFAVATDEILGGVWNNEGGLALIGRSRRVSQTALPPLRFETFAALARENANELAQSYERTNLFAGKLTTGTYSLRDWAPILLSDSLIDTEFGALLNITDQLLKSWSKAGHVDYLYFNYPLTPQNGFVFGKDDLRDIIKREIGGSQVLYNWNTAGAAVRVNTQGLNLLVAGHSSALPVTYGADINGGAMQTGDQLPKLLELENTAYKYYVERRDPNLAKVVSYNLIYQTLHFAHPAKQSTGTNNSKGQDILTEKAKEFLADIETGQLQSRNGEKDPEFDERLSKARQALSEYYKQTGTSREQLAILLASPRNNQAGKTENDKGSYIEKATSLQKLQDKLRTDIDRYNRDAEEVNNWLKTNNSTSTMPLALQLKAVRLDSDASEIQRRQSNFENEVKSFEEIKDRLMNQAKVMEGALVLSKNHLYPLIFASQDIDNIRAQFVKVHNHKPSGFIKTPTIVISWNNSSFFNALFVTGGHNLTVKAVNFTVDPSATAIRVERQADGGMLVRVPKSKENDILSHASEIARKLEHEQVDESTLLKQVGGYGTRLARTPSMALGEPRFDPANLICPGCATNPPTSKVYTYLMKALEQDSSFAVSSMRDEKGYFQSAYRKDGKPVCCLLFADTASLKEFLGAKIKDGPLVLIGENDPFAKNLADNLQADNPIALAAAAGGGGRRIPPGKSLPTSFDDAENFKIIRNENSRGGFETLGDDKGFNGDGSDSGHRGNSGSSDSSNFKGDRPIDLVWLGGKRELPAATTPRDFKNAAVSYPMESLAGKEPEYQLNHKSMAWNAKIDGNPYKAATLELQDERAPLTVHVIVGMDAARFQNGREAVEHAITAARDDASVRPTSLLQFRDKLKGYFNNNVKDLKRFVLAVKDKQELNFHIARFETETGDVMP